MDLIHEYPDYYKASNNPELVNIKMAHYLSILGKGSPRTDIFYDKKRAIKDFITALQRRFEGTEREFNSTGIEIFYWYDEKEDFVVDIGNFYTTLSLNLLQYRIAIRIPDFVTNEEIRVTAAQSKDILFAKEFERFTYAAGECIQMMHSGPFADELKTLPILQKFAMNTGWVKSGIHQEIHLTPFEKGQSQQQLKTILRDPVTRQSKKV